MEKLFKLALLKAALVKTNLQVFAGEDDPDNSDNDNHDDDKDKDKDHKDDKGKGKTFTQEEIDAMIEARLKREREKIKKEKEKKEKEKKKEEMTPEEKEKADNAEQLKQMQEMMAELKREKAINAATTVLSEKGLPVGMAKFVIGETDEDTLENINSIDKMIKDHIKAEVDKKVKSNVPGSGNTDPGTITKEQFAKMTLSEKNQLCINHPEVYKALTGR